MDPSGTAEHATSFDLASRNRLDHRDLPRFQDATLFHRIARTLCEADCVPRKELFESWEFARRTRRRFKGGRVLDLACGHGLIAHFLLIIDDSSESALAIDSRIPESAHKVSQALVRTWPRLAGRITIREQRIAQVSVEPGDLVVSAHACGGLTDEVLSKALEASARVVVLPCCQSTGKNDRGGLDGWLDADLAIDVTRAARLRERGYAVHTQRIPESITTKNRLLFGQPPS